MLSRIRYFVKKHIHYPVRDRVELIKTYSKIYKVTGRFIIYPSSVVFIFNKDRAFVETAFEDGNMAMEIVRFLGKLRRFNFSSLPLLPAGMLYRGIIWWREIPESINGWVEVDIKRAYPRVLYLVGAINSEDWKRAWLSKRISQAIIISLGMLQTTRYELVFKDGELAQEYYGKKSYAYNRVVSQFSLDTFRLNEIAIARYVDAFLIREDDLSVFQEELRRAGYFGAVKGRLSKIEDLGGIVKFYITEVGGRYKAWSYSYEQILRVYNSIDEG